MLNTMSKIRGQEKGPGYPQAEALLADAMLKFGKELGEECNFGNVIFIVLHLIKVIKLGLDYINQVSGTRRLTGIFISLLWYARSFSCLPSSAQGLKHASKHKLNLEYPIQRGVILFAFHLDSKVGRVQ